MSTVRFILLILFLLPMPCVAEEDPRVQLPEEEQDNLDWLNKPHKVISERFVSLSNSMDRFFADERIFQESRRSYLRLSTDLTIKEATTSDFKLRLRAKLVLPALQKRLKLLIESDDETADSIAPQPALTHSGAPNVDVPKDYRAGLQALLSDSTRWNITSDTGIRIELPLEPFVRLRARYLEKVDAWQFTFTETAFWYLEAGAGESTQFDADYKLSETLLTRSRTVATWRDQLQQFNYEQGFILFQHISQDNAMSYQASVAGASQPNTHVSGYALSVKWRHRIHDQWLFFEVQPVIAWPEEEKFHMTSSIMLRLEAIFGDVECGCYGI